MSTACDKVNRSGFRTDPDAFWCLVHSLLWLWMSGSEGRGQTSEEIVLGRPQSEWRNIFRKAETDASQRLIMKLMTVDGSQVMPLALEVLENDIGDESAKDHALIGLLLRYGHERAYPLIMTYL